MDYLESTRRHLLNALSTTTILYIEFTCICMDMYLGLKYLSTLLGVNFFSLSYFRRSSKT